MTGEVVTKKVLSADEIFAAEDRRTNTINVPEWGGDVIVQTMTADEAAALGEGDKKDGVARIVSLCCVDADGKRLFELSDIPKLQKKSFRALIRVHEIACEMNGLTPEAQKSVKKG